MGHVSQQATMKGGFLGVEGRPVSVTLLAQRANSARSSERAGVACFTMLLPTETPATRFIHAAVTKALRKLGSRL